MRRGLIFFSLAVLVAAVSLSFAQTGRAAGTRIHLDIRVDPVTLETERLLREAGLEIELGVPEFGRWQGWLAADQVERLWQVDGVVAVGRPQYATFAAGSALTEGDEALNASIARSRFNVDGSGVRIAVISDGIKGLEQAQLAGEAPKLAHAEAFGAGSLNRGQEGTVMIEIVHDLAPGAEISFAAVTTDLDHIEAVNYYAQHVDIIVDDVSYAFPADQRSDVSVNTTRALEHPSWPLRLYVTAAGNWAESHWAGPWRAGIDGSTIGLSSPGAVHQFNSGTSERALFGAGNGFQIETDDQIRLALFWDDPWGRSVNDYDLYLMSGAGKVLASSELRQGIGPLSHYPREHLDYTHDGGAAEVFVVIQNHNDDAAPVHFDLFAFNLDGVQPRLHQRIAEGSILAQSDAKGALTVGAVNVGGEMVAPYSSRGPTVNGAAKPEISAVDRVTVSDTTHFAPRFSGSSAAAPHVAGVAALLLEAQPALLSMDGGDAILERRLVRELLIDTARDIPPLGPDRASGAGLIDADAALHEVMNDAVVVTSPLDSGPGSLREALARGARIILFERQETSQTITLESSLPPVPADTTLDGTGWSIDASAVDVGLELGDRVELWGIAVSGARDVGVLLRGDGVRVSNVEVRSNRVGIRVAGSNAKIDGVTAIDGGSHGIEIAADASAHVLASRIESNRGAGVSIDAEAGDVLIGPELEPPALESASELWPPIGPLESAATLPRTGRSHYVLGTVSIDGLPAPEGTTVDVYLDRRLAAAVVVDRVASFAATAIGPGTELRFAVEGVALGQRVAFEAGGETTLTLRAASPSRLLAADHLREPLIDSNLIRNNLIGVEIIPTPQDWKGRRYVWGNVMQRNRSNVSSAIAAPRIEDYGWSAAGFNMSGTAEGAAVVHLYGGPPSNRRFVAGVAAVNDQFRFADIGVDQEASEFSVIGHTVDDYATAESEIVRLSPQGAIASVEPQYGFIEGGETVTICGERISGGNSAPSVWFGNQVARVSFWSEQCVTVTTPSSAAGLTDVVLLLPGERPIVAREAFEYRAERVVRLQQGWNFVTWSGPTTRVTDALSSIAGTSLRVYAWDVTQQKWRLFSTELPRSLNTLRTVTHDQPLWIFLDSPDVDWRQPAGD